MGMDGTAVVIEPASRSGQCMHMSTCMASEKNNAAGAGIVFPYLYLWVGARSD